MELHVFGPNITNGSRVGTAESSFVSDLGRTVSASERTLSMSERTLSMSGRALRTPGRQR